jgi:hypothetical protein
MKCKLLEKLDWLGDLVCPKCIRKVPNKNWFTKNGCIWCDDEYHRRKNK